jgi:hypothetical protein
MDQRVEEIEAEPDGDDQSDDRFNHLEPLQLTQSVRVEAHERQNRTTQRHERNVQHDHFLAGTLLGPTYVSFPFGFAPLGIRNS